MWVLVLVLLDFAEISFAGFPRVGDFGEDASDKAQEGFGAWEKTDDASSFFDLTIDIFAGVGCAKTDSESRMQGENGEAFWEIFFGPSGELWLGFGVGFDEVSQAEVGVGAVFGIEDGFDVGGDLGFEVLLGDIL